MSSPEATAGPPAPTWQLGAGAALERFRAVRHLVLGVLDDGRQLARVLGPLAEQLDSHFEAAGQAVDACRLNMVVIGAEGSGKSTLVNAITGGDVTPREPTHPGTVVPVFLLWSKDETPIYTVVLDDDGDERDCADSDDFGRYVLQRHNEHNEKGVLAGYVRWNHPLLERGLVLVDMPGVEGVSPEVALQAQEFIRKQAHAVIGVVRDRSYGPLLRVIRQLAGGNLRLQAVVSNWTLDAWVGTEEEAADFVASQQKVVADFLRQADAGVEVAEDDVYVLHLPSVCNRRLGVSPQVGSAAHQREEGRFEQAVWDYMRAHGVTEVSRAAAHRAKQALMELDALLGARTAVLTALIEGDERAGVGLADQLRTGQARVKSSWDQSVNPSAVDSVAGEQWESIRRQIETIRNQGLDRMRELETRVRAHPGRLRKPEADELWNRLCQDLADLRMVLAETEDQVVHEVIEHFCRQANTALDELFEAVPVLRAGVPAGFGDMTPGGLVELELSQVTEEERERLLRHPFVDRARQFLFGPIRGLIVGALLKGALAATKWWETVREGERPAFLVSLEKARKQVLALETSPESELRRVWGETVQRAADGVGRYLCGRVAQVEGIIADPKASLNVLAEQRNQVEHARSMAGLLIDRLEEVTRP